MSEIKITVDTSQAEAQLDELETTSNRINTQILTNMRRSAQLIFFGLEAAGIVIDQTLRLAAEGFLLVAEAALTASTLTGFGIAIRLTQAALLFAQIAAIRSQREKTARQLAGLEGALNIISMYG